jgi:hypothetical protein
LHAFIYETSVKNFSRIAESEDNVSCESFPIWYRTKLVKIGNVGPIKLDICMQQIKTWVKMIHVGVFGP